MKDILIHAHSGFRWVVLILLILTLVQTLRSRQTGNNGKLPLYTLIAAHLQMLGGLALYFLSSFVQFNSATMKDPLLRFYTVEHSSMMLISIILITIGYSKSKKSENSSKTLLTFYGIALLLILLAIPWPFRGLNAGWF